ncbi:hypothetical protein V8F06_006951 [Rhypophila decipiens]
MKGRGIGRGELIEFLTRSDQVASHAFSRAACCRVLIGPRSTSSGHVYFFSFGFFQLFALAFAPHSFRSLFACLILSTSFSPFSLTLYTSLSHSFLTFTMALPGSTCRCSTGEGNRAERMNELQTGTKCLIQS